MTIVDKFRERFGAQFKEHEPLGKHLNIRIGGPARYFVEARGTQELIDAVTFAREYAVPFFILGGGSNTLASDVGYDGLVIKAANRAMKIEGDRVVCEAGVISASVARMTADKGLRGFEWAISLPGTMGGAVRGNAGCFGGETRDSVESVRLLRNGEVIEVTNAAMGFAYRHSVLKTEGYEEDVVLDVTLKLMLGDRAEALALIDKHLANRKAAQPLGSSSCGCMFKNFEFTDESAIAELQKKYELPESFLTQQRITAGWIIDKLGLKGTAVG
ncbi:MAG: FAD-binding protein, partial [Candidatus Uhrbacteria bacterium]|nr:FAD-binding protein [Candidatus Uhrbacteria bacterium]